MRNSTNMSVIITWLVAGVVCLIVAAVPTGYFFTTYRYVSGNLETETEIKARTITQIISTNPEMWQFEQVRLEEYLSHRPPDGTPEVRRIFNNKGELVAERADLLAHPVIMRTTDLFESGSPVGKLEISRSLRPLLRRTAAVGVFMIVFGAGVFWVLRSLPIRAMHQAEMELRNSHQHLERLIAERTADLTMINARLICEIAERKQAEEAIRHQAYHDQLTGLPNRRFLTDRLSFELLQAQYCTKGMALMYVDLDRFKSINDLLGHTAGDLLLREAAGRLLGCVCGSDVAARVGGDEFNILLTDVTHPEDAARVADDVVSCLARPFRVNGSEFHISSSIGISVYPRDGEDVEELLKHADIAMYHAKEQGRNNYQFFTASMDTRTIEQTILENSLLQTLERGELALYYQPQIDCSLNRKTGTEALVRWRHPELGLLSPEKFIPIAEETGFIISLDEWVLRTACEERMKWQRAGYQPIVITVNLSARQFHQPNLISMISRVLNETGLGPEWLGIEITESIAMKDVDMTISNFRKLHDMGITLSLDDFGTGYSSLSYVSKLPVHRLKIDKSFIGNITENADDLAIVKAIIAMGHSLRLRVIAEGVETADQLMVLRASGCDEMQGYYFSEPVPAEEFKELFSLCK